jgi:basic membrane protein A and related proteins
LKKSRVAAAIVLAAALGAPMLGANAQSEKSVGLLFDITGRGDKSFNDSAAAGLDKAKAEFTGLKATESAPTGDADRPERAKALTDAKTGIIVCVGFLWDKDCNEAAKNNPTISFATIDGSLEGANTASLSFAEEQGSYLVGYAAGLRTKSRKIGFVGGVQIPLIQRFEAGFVAGVKAANRRATVNVQYVSQPPDFSGFNDATKGKAIAAAMYKSGIDIVYHAAGSTGNGVFLAAQESGKKPGQIWAIGVDADQYNIVAKNAGKDYIMTSMLKRVDVATYQAIKAYVDGKPLTGARKFDLKDDGVGYAISNPAGLPKSIQTRLDKVKADIIAGKIVVPTTPSK